MKTDNLSNQLRWVVLLLAAAVILPTVCLLWFMNQAVKNERLAVRQKLLDICDKEIETLEQQLIEATQLPSNASNPDPLIDQSNITRWIKAIKENANSVVIYDKSGNLIYPIISSEPVSEFSSDLQRPLELERQGQLQKALELYQDLTDPNQPPDELFQSCMGQIRCLDKLGRVIEADDFILSLRRSDHIPFTTQVSPTQHAMLRVKRVELLARHQDKYHVDDMFDDLTLWYTKSELYSSQTTIWALGKILDVTPEFRERFRLDDSIELARNTIETERTALMTADFLGEHPEYKEQSAHRWLAVNSMPDMYMMFSPSPKYDLYYIKDRNSLKSSFDSIFGSFPIHDITLVLYDNLGQAVYGPDTSEDNPFVVSDLNDFSTGWKLKLYLNNDTSFQEAAKRQQYIYFWTAFLMIFLVLLIGGISIRVVNLQARTNRLKNDFIATVTHELKTPLASMRLLVDTLLEGNYEGEKTATEYLQLVANENKRLTHLIDSFLTFSRMERNKLVFEMAAVSPVEVAKRAVEAVGTKFDNGKVSFKMDVQKSVPMMCADEDGMVAVLVNLLDNAYKYTNSDKQIELNVYQQNGSVCFAVTDNGVGLSSRVQRKIFKRFYQADNRLSRSVEGCGLGLSIVKFIVDAHKGAIEVESQPEQGSTFTVRIPIAG